MRDRIDAIVGVLRKKILESAVRGELVPQNPKDEPASVLVERLAKERLTKQTGKRNATAVSSRIERRSDGIFEIFTDGSEKDITDEIPFTIPGSWEWVRLGEIAETDLGKTLDKNKTTGDLHPYLCSINIDKEEISFRVVKHARFEASELSRYKLRPGDLLICEGGDVGKAAVWEANIPMYYQNALHRLRFFGGILPHYIKRVIELYKLTGVVERFCKGVTIKHLVQTELRRILIPLPPLSEQKRIAEALKSRLHQLDTLRAMHQRIQRILRETPTSLRQQLLQAAIEGKLVAQDPKDEPASVLLERIAKEREEKSPGKRKGKQISSRIVRRNNGTFELFADGAEKDITDEIPFDIPDSWEWVRLSSVVYLISGQDLPSKVFNECKVGVPYITGASNFNAGSLVLNRWTDKPRCCAKQGDILLTCKGTIGELAILKEPIVHVARQVMAVRPVHSCESEYIYYFLNTKIAAYQDKARSMIPGISRNIVLDTLMPLPPIAEQKSIVERLEKLLAQLERIG